MVSGSIVKIVDTYGSQWGHVRPAREPRQLFFNAGSLGEGVDFSTLAVGDDVEFDQEPDRANGLRAIHMRRLEGSAAAVAAVPAETAVQP